MTAPLMALAIPLLDTALSISRRWIRGQPLLAGDRHHIHHKLLDRGLTHRGVVIVLYLMCGVYAALSLLQSTAEKQSGGLILILFCLVTWIGVQNLGYAEFGLAGMDYLHIAEGFREFTPYRGACRFQNCRHLNEPGCALHAAAETGSIHARRLALYQRIVLAEEAARTRR